MGGIYINELETDESAPTLNYTMIANDLVMTRLRYYANINRTKIDHTDIEIQRRLATRAQHVNQDSYAKTTQCYCSISDCFQYTESSFSYYFQCLFQEQHYQHGA